MKIIITIIGILLMFNFSSNQKAEKKFWKWLQNNEELIFNFEVNQEEIFDLLITELHRVNDNLTFEFGPIVDNKREFVISADGIKDAFSSVFSLKETEPNSFKKFHITYFRPRRNEINTISFGDLTLSPDDIFIDLEVIEEKIGITLFIKDYTIDQRNNYIGHVFILLDESLGEYDVETKVGYIDLQPLTDQDAIVSFHKLSKYFDEKYLEITPIN